MPVHRTENVGNYAGGADIIPSRFPVAQKNGFL